MGTILKEMVGLASKAREEGRHVKVMILNAGNAAMFLNMMCSAQRRVGLSWAGLFKKGWRGIYFPSPPVSGLDSCRWT